MRLNRSWVEASSHLNSGGTVYFKRGFAEKLQLSRCTRHEGHGRGRQTQPGEPAARRNGFPQSVQHLLRTLCGPPPRGSEPFPQAIALYYPELPATRRLSSAARSFRLLRPDGLILVNVGKL